MMDAAITLDIFRTKSMTVTISKRNLQNREKNNHKNYARN